MVGSFNGHTTVKTLVWTLFYSSFWSSWADLSFAPIFRVWSRLRVLEYRTQKSEVWSVESENRHLYRVLKTNGSKYTRGLDPLYGDACSAKSFEVLHLILSTDCSRIDWLQSVLKIRRFKNLFLDFCAMSGTCTSSMQTPETPSTALYRVCF